MQLNHALLNLPVAARTTENGNWWVRKDSNLLSNKQQIYSLP